MADEENATAAELPSEEKEEGDIEQARRISSLVAGAITGGTSTHTSTTKSPLVGLEQVDVEDAAPLSLIQQRADIVEKDDGNTTAVALASSNASPTLHPPKQDAMEQIEDGDDVAPHPYAFDEFEDDSKPKNDLGEESIDEDDGPPLPFRQQRTQNYSTSHYGNTRQRQVVSSAERDPSVPILEAYLVIEDEGSGDFHPTAVVTPDGHDTVYEATPLEPELPWWKQRRTKVFMVIICLLLLTTASLAAAAGLGTFSRSTADTENNTAETTTSITTRTPTLSPSTQPSESSAPTTTRTREIKNILSTVSDSGALDDADSPQGKALEWITFTDPIAPQLQPGTDYARIIQRFVLTVLYYATNGDSWRKNDKWLTGANECDWYWHEGEACNAAGLVMNLVFIGNALRGEIPTEVGSLSNLEKIVLMQNALSGEIPTEFGSLSNLGFLVLQDNFLRGKIPTELGKLSNLGYIDLSFNNLSGEIPKELGSLSYLGVLGLNVNKLSGEIPTQLGSLSNLGTLYLDGNADLIESVPGGICALKSLSDLKTDWCPSFDVCCG